MDTSKLAIAKKKQEQRKKSEERFEKIIKQQSQAISELREAILTIKNVSDSNTELLSSFIKALAEQDTPTIDIEPLKSLLDEKLKQTVDLSPITQHIDKTFKKINFTPVINVEAPEVIVPEPDIFAVYDPTDSDEKDKALTYYLFTKEDGAWFILRQSGGEESSKQWRYAAGTEKYKEAWAKHKGLPYKPRSEVTINV